MNTAILTPCIEVWRDKEMVTFNVDDNGLTLFDKLDKEMHFMDIIKILDSTSRIDTLVIDGFIPTVNEMDNLYLILSLNCLIYFRNTKGLYKEFPSHLKIYGEEI